MSTESRKIKHRQELSRLILESAISLISKIGYENFTMRQLAEKIEYSTRTIYLHFKSKEDLIDAITEQVFFMSLEHMNTQDNLNLPADEIFRTMINRHIRNGLLHPELYRAVITNINRSGYKTSEPELIFYRRIEHLINSKSPETTEILLSSLRSTTLLIINKLPDLKEEQLEKYISNYTNIILRGIQ